jgi:hypothetical protein
VNGTDPLGLWEPLGTTPAGGGVVNGHIYGAPAPHYLGENDDPNAPTSFTGYGLLADFLTGGGATNRSYGLDSPEGRGMQRSPAAQAMRNQFYAGGCKSISGFNYGTGRAFVDTILINGDPFDTAGQVGGFAGGSVTNNGDGTMTFNIDNVAGAYSFFLHAVPDRTGTTGPLRSINQTFNWTEPISR